MNKLKPYLSVLMLALLLFPLGKKAVHEFGHLSEVHCSDHEKHYCAVEHTCQLCDYVFSSQAMPPETMGQAGFFIPFVSAQNAQAVFNTLSPLKFTFFLRGPPRV